MKNQIEKSGFAKKVAARMSASPLILWGMFSSLLAPSPCPVLLRTRTRRGAGMLEYALIALISIGVFVALNEFFPDFFQGILDGIQEQFEDTQ